MEAYTDEITGKVYREEENLWYVKPNHSISTALFGLLIMLILLALVLAGAYWAYINWEAVLSFISTL